MKCNDFENNIILFLYDELSESESLRLSEHLDSCTSCREFLAEHKKMFSDITESSAETFTPDWDEYWSNIKRSVKRTEKKRWSFFPFPSGAAAFAMSLLILAGGIFIGRFFISSPDTDSPVFKKTSNHLYVQYYFEDIKPVMLDYANYSIPAAGGNGGPVDKEIVTDMLNRTRLLKRHVSTQNEPYLASLLEELELILTEIKNTAPGEKESIRSLQGMIRENDIHLKIDLLKNKAKRSQRI